MRPVLLIRDELHAIVAINLLMRTLDIDIKMFDHV